MPTDIETWSAHDVGGFCKAIGLSAEIYKEIVDNLVDGKMLAEITDEVLDAHCVSSGLARFKRPRRYQFIDQIPKSPVGKILRRVLVADYSDPQPAEQP